MWPQIKQTFIFLFTSSLPRPSLLGSILNRCSFFQLPKYLFFSGFFFFLWGPSVGNKGTSGVMLRDPNNRRSPRSQVVAFAMQKGLKQTELLMIPRSLSLPPSLNNGTSVGRPRGEVMESWISKRTPLGGPQGGTTGSLGKQEPFLSFFFCF